MELYGQSYRLRLPPHDDQLVAERRPKVLLQP